MSVFIVYLLIAELIKLSNTPPKKFATPVPPILAESY